VDTNCDPTEVDHVIPGNDDALRAIRLFTSRIADACAEGRHMLESGGQAPEGGAEGAAAEQSADEETPAEFGPASEAYFEAPIPDAHEAAL
jgi:small subunit ribosomal protein S2